MTAGWFRRRLYGLLNKSRHNRGLPPVARELLEDLASDKLRSLVAEELREEEREQAARRIAGGGEGLWAKRTERDTYEEADRERD